jgi:hypothetical protein
MIQWKRSAFHGDQHALDDPSIDSFGRAIARWLAHGECELSPDVSERLRAARLRAVACRKAASEQARPLFAWPDFVLSLGRSQRWLRIGSIAPLVALIAGLFLIKGDLDDRAAQLEAQVDVQLLTDVLPPRAYIDAGFREFLRPSRPVKAIHQDSPKPDTTRVVGQDA